ncbi:MAG: protein kinase [Polyangiaceae bacterium]|nr:protein kinase [Polyangiaceae bacterium]
MDGPHDATIDRNPAANGAPPNGLSVAELLATQGHLAVPEAVELVVLACESLHPVHLRGAAHRALSPVKLRLIRQTSGAEVEVLGLGEPASTGSSAGRSGTTPDEAAYLAPEQVRANKTIDRRTDIWALGVLLYHGLVGCPPFTGSDFRSITGKILIDEPPRPRRLRDTIPAELEAIVLRCLEKTPSHRYQSVADLVQALLPFVPESARANAERVTMAGRTTAHGNGAARAAAGQARRRVVIALVLVGLVLLVLTLALTQRGPPVAAPNATPKPSSS